MRCVFVALSLAAAPVASYNSVARSVPKPQAHVCGLSRSRTLRAATLEDAKKGSGFLLQVLPSGKASWLMHTWGNSAATERANGFSPSSEAIGDGALRMKWLADNLPRLTTCAKILGLCENGNLSFDKLEEPHASMAEQLSRTRLVAAISAGKGSAIAFVSSWPEHVSIDGCVINPAYMSLGQGAESALIEHVTQQALDEGVTDIRLTPTYQVEGDVFYERLGFFPSDGDTSGPTSVENDRTFYYRVA